MSFVAHDWVAHHARHRPDALALGCAEDGRTSTWGELEDRVGRLAGALADWGVRPGARIALIAENHPRVFEVQFAAMRLGAIFVPLNWRLSQGELVTICRDATPALLVHDQTWARTAADVAAGAQIRALLAWDLDAGDGGEYEAAIKHATHRAPSAKVTDETATHIIYTSGTTGLPKGAIYTHSTLLWQNINSAHAVGFAESGCHQLNQMPLFHAGGLTVMANPILYFGGAVTTLARFAPDRALESFSTLTPPVTHFAGIPLMYQAIADQPGWTEADLSHLRHLVVAGAIATPELLRRWADRGAPLQPHYGGTEMGPLVCALNNEADHQDKAEAGSCGRPVFHTELRLVDSTGSPVPEGEVGEVWLRGPSVTTGYWGKSREPYFADGGWFRTGDAARRDSEGFYYLAGRTREMYKSGGENVYPAEVENVLAVHPDVLDIAVVGVPDPTWDEVGLAVVVPRAGAAPTLEQLCGYAEGKLARYKLPKHLVLVDELPRNVTGKVSRDSLRRMHAPVAPRA